MVVSTHFHLVQKAHAQHTVFIDLAPHGLTLQLHARHAIEDALHFQREVHVSKGVDDVDAVILPLERGGDENDGDFALLRPREGRDSVE